MYIQVLLKIDFKSLKFRLTSSFNRTFFKHFFLWKWLEIFFKEKNYLDYKFDVLDFGHDSMEAQKAFFQSQNEHFESNKVLCFIK